MNIVSTQYNLQNKTLEIYLSGCYGDCYNCHNPELKDFNIGNYYSDELPKIIQKIYEFDSLIDNIWILGGEPLDQDILKLNDLLNYLTQTNKKIWLWTRYELNEIPELVKRYCNYIKCGKYIKKLKTDNNIQFGVKLASSNQRIYKIEV
jgi:anaerobic ribonucleoside-triphosphate reductase activating protein